MVNITKPGGHSNRFVFFSEFNPGRQCLGQCYQSKIGLNSKALIHHCSVVDVPIAHSDHIWVSVGRGRQVGDEYKPESEYCNYLS